jgi:hypothetical protein
VLADTRLAVLNRAFGVALSRYPEVNAMLLERLDGRAERLATTKAIAQLNSVDRRLLALFWHLAEDWGRDDQRGHRGPTDALAPPARRTRRRAPADRFQRPGDALA